MATRFGDFMLKEDLGSSRVADRFTGMHDNLGGPFFIKKYTRLGGDFTADLAARCEVLMRIKHHVLAPHLGHGDVDGVPFVVSPLLDGADLHAFAESLRTRRVVLPLAAMLYILREVARGVEALHQTSEILVHGNVTAKHGRLGVNGEVWITGLATPRGEVAGSPPDAKWDGAGVAATTYDLIGLTRPTRDRPPLPLPLDRLVRRGLGIGNESDYIGAGALADGIEEIAGTMSLKLHRGVLAEVAGRTHAALLRTRGRTAAEKLPTLEPLENTPAPRAPKAAREPPPKLAPLVEVATTPSQPAPPKTKKVTVVPPARITPVPPPQPDRPPPTTEVVVQPAAATAPAASAANPTDAAATPKPPAPRKPPEPGPTRPLTPLRVNDAALPPDEPLDSLGAPPGAPTAPQERIPHPDEVPAMRPTVESPVLPPPPVSEEGLAASFNEVDSFVEDGNTRPEMNAAPSSDSIDRLTMDPTLELQGPVSSTSDGPDLPPEVDSIFKTGRPAAPEPPNPTLGRLFADMGSPAPMLAGKTTSFLVDPLTEATEGGVATVPAAPPAKTQSATSENENEPEAAARPPSTVPPTLAPPKMAAASAASSPAAPQASPSMTSPAPPVEKPSAAQATAPEPPTAAPPAAKPSAGGDASAAGVSGSVPAAAGESALPPAAGQSAMPPGAVAPAASAPPAVAPSTLAPPESAPANAEALAQAAAAEPEMEAPDAESPFAIDDVVDPPTLKSLTLTPPTDPGRSPPATIPSKKSPLAPPSGGRAPALPQDRAVAAFLRSGRLTNTQLDEALAVQRARGGHIVDILVSQGVVTETAVADSLADEAVKQRIDEASLEKRRAAQPRLRRMPESYARSHCVLVLDGPADGPLTLAMADPFDKDALAEVRRMFGASLVQVQVAERTVLKRAIQAAYGAMSTVTPGEGQPTLLLCTNDDEQVTTIGARLAAEGFAVEHAATGTLATRLLKKNQPNAILCDYALPGTGEDVLLAARQLDVSEEVPFFMYGEDDDGDVEARCLDLGADDFFPTPFKLDVVLRKIRRAIVKNSRKMRSAPTTSTPPPTPSPASPKPSAPSASMFGLDAPPLSAPPVGDADSSPIPEEFGMVVTDVPAEPTGVMGTLKQMAVPEIVQSLEMGRKTARVELVPNDADAGRFWFDTGQIVYAEAGELFGEDAFYQLARHTEGFFRISYGDEPTKRNIEKPTTFLLLEAMRLMDEEGQS